MRRRAAPVFAIVVGVLASLTATLGPGPLFAQQAAVEAAPTRVADFVPPPARDHAFHLSIGEIMRVTWEAGNAVRAGLEWAEALRAVTLTPAEVFGVGDDYGSLAAGKVANVVVWTGDPFELSSRPAHVVIRGAPVPATSRQRELFERYRSLDEGVPPAYR